MRRRRSPSDPLPAPVPAPPLGANPTARDIPWTGERMVPWTDDIAVVYEHFHRYLFAADVIATHLGGRQARVLDLASGEGYGSSLLHAQGHLVMGVELDPEAVAHATARYATQGLVYSQGSMLSLTTVTDASVDVVVCFEALEHIVEQEQLMDEVARVLRPDGIFLVSTPDVEVYTHDHGRENEFHVKELTRQGFTDLLARRWGHVRLWGQTPFIGSLLRPVDGAEGETVLRGLQVNDRTMRDSWGAADAAPPVYYVAVASGQRLDLAVGPHAMTDPDELLVKRLEYERDQARQA